MAFALGISGIPVPSLMAVAARDEGPVSPGLLQVLVQDARMQEVYLAAYQVFQDGQGKDWTLFQSPILLGVDQIGTWLEHAAAQLRSSGRDALVGRILGDALLAYPAVGAALAGKAWLEQGQPLRPDAATVARLALRAWRDGQAIAPELAAPLYVRDKVAYTTLERQPGDRKSTRLNSST